MYLNRRAFRNYSARDVWFTNLAIDKRSFDVALSYINSIIFCVSRKLLTRIFDVNWILYS